MASLYGTVPVGLTCHIILSSSPTSGGWRPSLPSSVSESPSKGKLLAEGEQRAVSATDCRRGGEEQGIERGASCVAATPLLLARVGVDDEEGCLRGTPLHAPQEQEYEEEFERHREGHKGPERGSHL